MSKCSASQTTIFLLGTLPPPMGGVSVYCLRRINQLATTRTKCVLFDTKSTLSILKLWYFSILYRLTNRPFTIEINTSNPIAIFLLNILGLLPNSIFVDHNSSRRFKGKHKEAQLLNLARFCKQIKLVNSDLIKNYQDAGVRDFKNFSVFSPYIRPTDEEIEAAHLTHRQSLSKLVSNNGRNIVLSSAWKPTIHEDGKDLYGIIDTLEIYKELAPSHPEIQFVFLIGETDSSQLCTSATKTALQLSQEFQNFHFLCGGIPQWPLLKNTIVLLRLTRTDGDSVSVREALDFGAEVIATDVCSRPTGVHLTSLDDIQQTRDLLKSILRVVLQRTPMPCRA